MKTQINNDLKYKKAFTLVELIIVITILVILATIAFVSFQNYTKDSRDANRLTTINNIYKGLDIFQIKTGFYPEPENSINILASGSIIAKQGFFGENQSSIINMDKLVIDPLDENKFTYYTDINKKKYQILLFLEGNNNIGLNSKIKVYAEENYTNRFPKVYGNKLGILLDNNNTPVQTLSLTGIDIIKTNYIYKAIFDNTNDGNINGSGITLKVLFQNIKNGGVGFGAPISCPIGFIPVPGNKEFNQTGFCIMKYEASYSDNTIPNTCAGSGCPLVEENIYQKTDWNTVSYNPLKTVISKYGLYPISNITQEKAIESCNSIGAHLITNNERMTIARNIEEISDNWSKNKVGTGGIYVGIVGDQNSNNSLGCSTSNSNGIKKRTFAAGALGNDTNLWGNKKGSDCDSKRQLKLSNGEVIWDLSGNLREHVNKSNTLDGTNYSLGRTSISGCLNSTDWSEFNTCTDNFNTSKNILLNSNNGIGRIYFSQGVPNNIFLRGGSAVRTGNNSGIYSLYLYHTGISFGRSVGFRCSL